MISVTMQPPRLSPPWRVPLPSVLLLVVLLLLAYRDTAAAMEEIWSRSGNFTHCYVVPVLSAWLIWRRRADLALLTPRPAPWVLLPMAGLALLWWLSTLVSVAAGAQLALTAMLVATVPLVLGWQVTRMLAFPLAFLFFAVPIGEFLTPLLMRWTVDALVGGLRLSGIPVYQEGQQLVIPSGRWAVVAACSGIRYLMASFMVGSLFAYLNYQSTRRRVLFMAVSLVLPVVANWVRAYIIVMLGHLSNNEIATGADHLVYGWVFFGIVIMALFFIGARWAEPEPPAAQPQPAGSAGATAMVTAWRPALVAGLALVAALWPLIHTSRVDVPSGRTPVPLTLPDTLGRWQAQAEAPANWVPYVVGANTQIDRTYRSAQGTVTVNLAYYRHQGTDAKLVSSANRLVEGGTYVWNVLAQGQTRSGSGEQAQVWRTAQILAQDGATGSNDLRTRLTVWHLYWVGGRVLHDDIAAKLWQAWLAVRGEPDDGAAIHLYATLPDPKAADALLAAFVAENFGAIQDVLRQARERR